MSKKIMLKSVFLVFMLIGIASAAGGCDVARDLDFSSSGDPTSADNNWKTWSVIGLFISGSLISLMFMFGKAFGNRSLLNRAKTEINQLIATVLILALFTVTVTAMCSVDGRELGLPSESLFDSAHDYLSYAKSTVLFANTKSADAIMGIGGLSTIYVSAANTLPTVSISFTISTRPFSGFAVMLGPLRILSSLVHTFGMVTVGYEAILTIIENSFLNLLLPIGVVLRSFTPTRDIGGVFMAIAIGLFLFYPMMFSLSYLMIGTPDPLNVVSTSYTGMMIQEVSYFTVASFIPFAFPITLATRIAVMSDFASELALEALTAAGNVILPTFILPAINWIVIVAVVRWMSKVMGEEVDISGLTRLV